MGETLFYWKATTIQLIKVYTYRWRSFGVWLTRQKANAICSIPHKQVLENSCSNGHLPNNRNIERQVYAGLQFPIHDNFKTLNAFVWWPKQTMTAYLTVHIFFIAN